MRGAWDAILRGDYDERDRLCERGKQLLEAEQYSSAMEKVLKVDFFVMPSGTVIPTKTMTKAAGAIQ